ncbi:P-loop containing nucleoside triphosphate hydrolase protein [Lactarius pseudohatsudake]|nr:P-loop containing nucleoside triphosphate hydrolase protein [Lactarius pseudohatsudake]
MPSASIAAAVLAVADTVWGYDAWQDRTKNAVAPFQVEASTGQTGLTQHELDAVRALAARVHCKPQFREQVVEIAKAENDNIGSDIEVVLDRFGRHPRQLVMAIGTDKEKKSQTAKELADKIPTMNHAQLFNVKEPIAIELFGLDAYESPYDPNPFIKGELVEFIDTFLAHIWNQSRKAVGRQWKRLEKGKVEAEVEYEKLNGLEWTREATAADFQPWFKKVDRLLMLASGFRDDVGEKALMKQLENVGEVYKALTGEVAPDQLKGLSKNLKDALQRIATGKEAAVMSEQLAERLEAENLQLWKPVKFDFEPEGAVEWSEGVENLQNKTPEELYKLLGLGEESVPFFREKITVDATADESDGGTTTNKRFSLRWHQLVGVVKMLERAMASQPVLLMDDVGLGKTVQVLAFFAMLAYYREAYAETGKYPGIWGQQDGWRDYRGRQSVLPEYPFLIVVPPTLVEQVTLECTRFLKPGSLDVIRVTGSLDQHKDLWTEADKRAKVAPHMRLYVASTTALQSDSSAIHVVEGPAKPSMTVRARFIESQTIFGRRYLGVAIDEAHGFRNVNKLYSAVRALRDKTDMFVAMTTTPVQTRLADLWNIGKVIGLPAFDDKNDRETKKIVKTEDQGKVIDYVTEYLRGKTDPKQVDTISQYIGAVWVNIIREKYQGSVIRRTVNSKDHTGEPISGLEPYEEHRCVIELHEHEYTALERFAKDAVDNESFVRQFASENFYLDIRKTLLHPWCVEGEKKRQDVTYEMYEAAPSAKLDSLVEILKHHLEADGAPVKVPTRQADLPLSAFKSSSSEEKDEEQQQQHQQQQQQQAPKTPDKIIVYSFFSSAFWLIKMVLKRHGIKALSIHGKVKQQDRTKRLKEFMESGRNGARVLLMSNVGTVGLNIACANILIIVDVLWSVLSEQQLIGRVWRYPQPKTVHVYRLIGGNSPDIFLNNISFSKGFIQDTFSNIGEALQKALKLGDDVTDFDITPDFEEVERDKEATPKTTPQPRRKGKKKQAKAAPKAAAPEVEAENAAAEPMKGGGMAPAHGHTLPAEASLSKSRSDQREDALPCSFKSLEDRLPNFVAPESMLDQMDSDFDTQFNTLQLADHPDMLGWVRMQLELLRSQRLQLLLDLQYADMLPWLEERESALKAWEKWYAEEVLARNGEQMRWEEEWNMVVGRMEETDENQDFDRPPLTELSSVSGSDFTGSMPASASSKRSRADLTDEEMEPSGSQTGKGKGKEQRNPPKENPAPQSMYKRRNVSGRSTPAVDSQFLEAQAQAPARRGRSKSTQGRRTFGGDASKSFDDLSKSWEGSSQA